MINNIVVHDCCVISHWILKRFQVKINKSSSGMQTEVIYMTDRQYSVISNISIISTNVRCNVTFSATAFVHDVIQPLVRHHLSMLYIMQTHCQTPPPQFLKWKCEMAFSSTAFVYDITILQEDLPLDTICSCCTYADASLDIIPPHPQSLPLFPILERWECGHLWLLSTVKSEPRWM